jgi:hypothetical protein
MTNSLTALLLLVGMLVPHGEIVLCTESDGRSRVEAGVVGHCVDMLLAATAQSPTVGNEGPTCSDSELPSVRGTVSRTDSAVDQASLVGFEAKAPGPHPQVEARSVGTLCQWLLLPLQHEQIASVVLLR